MMATSTGNFSGLYQPYRLSANINFTALYIFNVYLSQNRCDLSIFSGMSLCLVNKRKTSTKFTKIASALHLCWRNSSKENCSTRQNGAKSECSKGTLPQLISSINNLSGICSLGWVHYCNHRPEPHILLFSRALPQPLPQPT